MVVSTPNTLLKGGRRAPFEPFPTHLWRRSAEDEEEPDIPPPEPPTDPSTDPEIDYPPGTKFGDHIYTIIFSRDATGAPGVAQGAGAKWEKVYERVMNSRLRPYVAVYQRAKGASDTSVQITGSKTGKVYVMRTTGYRTYSDGMVRYTTASASGFDPAAVYADCAGAAVVFLGVNGSYTLSPPSGYTALVTENAALTTGIAVKTGITAQGVEDPGQWGAQTDHFTCLTLFLPLKSVSAPSGHSDYFNTGVLLPFNEANASTTFVEKGPMKNQGWTALGNAQHSTSTVKYGSGCYLSDGTGDGIRVQYGGISLTPRDRPFTLDFWWRPTANVRADFFARWGLSEFSYLFFYESGNLKLSYSTNGTTTAATLNWAHTPTLNTYAHIAFVRDFAGDIQAAVDGTWLGTKQAANVEFWSQGEDATEMDVYVGCRNSSGGGSVTGRLDAFRFNHRSPIWTPGTNFTPPTGELGHL